MSECEQALPFLSFVNRSRIFGLSSVHLYCADVGFYRPSNALTLITPFGVDTTGCLAQPAMRGNIIASRRDLKISADGSDQPRLIASVSFSTNELMPSKSSLAFWNESPSANLILNSRRLESTNHDCSLSKVRFPLLTRSTI